MIDFSILIPIFGIVCGTILSGFVIWKIIDLIKVWITRNNGSYDDETIERMAKAFIKHKKDTERRLENIETIITEDDSSVPLDFVSGQLKDQQSRDTIEIESKDSELKQKNKSTGNLNNMLHKKSKE